MDADEQKRIDAVQAISPAGLGDQSVEGNSGPGSELPNEDIQDVPPTELEDEYLNEEGDDVASNVRQLHPNRNPNGKPQLDKPSYGGGH